MSNAAKWASICRVAIPWMPPSVFTNVACRNVSEPCLRSSSQTALIASCKPPESYRDDRRIRAGGALVQRNRIQHGLDQFGFDPDFLILVLLVVSQVHGTLDGFGGLPHAQRLETEQIAVKTWNRDAVSVEIGQEFIANRDHDVDGEAARCQEPG